MRTVKFEATGEASFYKVANLRVKQYFARNGFSKHANSAMVLKTLFMLSLYFVPFGWMLSGPVKAHEIYICFVLMGLGIPGIGLSVMHDANHGSYSSKKWINTVIGYTINLIGGNKMTWTVQHRIHHFYTNIYGMDVDMDAGYFFKFARKKSTHFHHKWQYLYFPLLYLLLTFTWITIKEFVQLIQFKKMGALKRFQLSFNREMTILIVSKIFYYFYMLLVPIYLFDVPWEHWLLGFCIMHLIAGGIITVVLQTSHLIETVDQPNPDEHHRMSKDWATHQLSVTSNYATGNKLYSWYCGNLNYHIEHHLFPGICHIHYPAIAKLVKQTAKEFNLEYQENYTIRQALILHVRLLRSNGQSQVEKINFREA